MTNDGSPSLDISGLFDLEHHGPDVWVADSPPYSWGRIYGGCVVAQALWAATQTVQTEHLVHSLHAYFILGGNLSEPVRYEVDRIRNGRSFSTRRVVARQSNGAILNLSCSFQRYEDGDESQVVEFPTDATKVSEGSIVEDSGTERILCDVGTQARALKWMRFPGTLEDDPRLHAAALAYLSDSAPMQAIGASHPKAREASFEEQYDDPNMVVMAASLDHSIWFHRPVQASDWLLFDLSGHGFIRTRGLATGHVFSEDGVHVATVAQEGLIRSRRLG